jgi:hypothetical protein
MATVVGATMKVRCLSKPIQSFFSLDSINAVNNTPNQIKAEGLDRKKYRDAKMIGTLDLILLTLSVDFIAFNLK